MEKYAQIFVSVDDLFFHEQALACLALHYFNHFNRKESPLNETQSF